MKLISCYQHQVPIAWHFYTFQLPIHLTNHRLSHPQGHYIDALHERKCKWYFSWFVVAYFRKFALDNFETKRYRMYSNLVQQFTNGSALTRPWLNMKCFCLSNRFCMLYRAINGDSETSAGVERREDPGPQPHAGVGPQHPQHHRYEVYFYKYWTYHNLLYTAG